MLDYIYRYAYCGELHDNQHINDIELILFNNNIPYKIEKVDSGVKVYVSLMHEEIGKDIVENLKTNNLIYRKVISFDDIKVRKRNVIKKFEYRGIMMVLFLLIFIILFMRSLLLLNIMN